MPHADVTPLYVRLPRAQAEGLDRAAFESGVSKREIITRLVAGYLGEHVPTPTPEPRVEQPSDQRLVLGRHEFRPAAPPEVLTIAQTAELLQVDEDVVRQLLDAHELPGRRVGDEWRLARRAVLDWLAAESESEPA